jgi:uncharacterized protein (DUF1330 family)
MRMMFLWGVMAVPALAAEPPPVRTGPGVCDNKPVIMLVAGDIKDRARLLAYGAAIRDSGLYDRLGGYYINVPRVIETFEGQAPPTQSMLMVRFPCLAHARAFWFSKEYQEKLKPLRLNPSAGDFVVTVYPEAAPPPGVAAWWPPFGPLKQGEAGLLEGIEQSAAP